MGKYAILLIIIVILGSSVLFMRTLNNKPSPANNTQTNGAQPTVAINMTDRTYTLDQLSNSGESGTVNLKEVDGKVTVTIKTNGTSTTPEPAHIHTGSCPTPGAIRYPLTSVIGGSSVTTLNVTLAQILNDVPLAVNIHKSSAEAQTYMSCGNLTK